MQTSASSRIAAILVALEGIGLLAVAGWQVVALASGDTGSPGTAVALIVLTVIAAAAVVAFASGIWRDLSWGRSGGVVTQVMILAVALGAATGDYAHPAAALALAAPAAATLIVLIVAARRAAATMRAAEAEASGDEA